MNKEMLQKFAMDVDYVHNTLIDFIASQPDQPIGNYCISIDGFGEVYIQELKGGQLIDDQDQEWSLGDVSVMQLIYFIEYNLI